MDSELEESIAQNAQAPARASDDSGSMEQHPLPDQIATDRYLKSKKASRKRGLPVKFAKLAPPGTE